VSKAQALGLGYLHIFTDERNAAGVGKVGHDLERHAFHAASLVGRRKHETELVSHGM
jgi:hypothetical protein